MFKPLIDIRERMYDMAYDPAMPDIMTVTQGADVNAICSALAYTQEDWWAKRRATDLLMEHIGGVVTRVGDETMGEMCSMRWTLNLRRILKRILVKFRRVIHFKYRLILTQRMTGP